MSQPQLASLANSSLANTLSASSSVDNRQIYSTPPIVPGYSLIYSDIQPSNGTTISNQTQNFQISKFGIIESMILNYTRNLALTVVGNPANATNLPINDAFSVISRIELLSSSRVISIMTAADLIASYSNLSLSEYEAIRIGSLRTGAPDNIPASGTTVANQTISWDYALPLYWGQFFDINTQFDSSFLENLNIRVTWGNQANIGNASTTPVPVGTNTTLPVTDTFLTIRYKNYGEEATSQYLSENFKDESLNIVSSRFFDEQPVIHTVAAGDVNNDQVITLNLRNTDVVSDIYVMVREFRTNNTLGVPKFIPLLEMTGSGQQIFKMKGRSQTFTKIQENGKFVMLQQPADNEMAMENVFKFQMGCWNSYAISGMMSLREINNPTITCTFPHLSKYALAAGRYQLDVVEDCRSIFSINSNSGRYSLALSN